MAARAGFAERERREMPAGGDVLQRIGNGSSGPRRDNCRGGAHVHEINHGDRRVGFGERRGDGRERERAQAGAADLGRQRQPEQPGLPQRLDGLSGEATCLVVCPGSRRQRAIGNLFGLRNRGLMSQTGSRIDHDALSSAFFIAVYGTQCELPPAKLNLLYQIWKEQVVARGLAAETAVMWRTPLQDRL